MYHSNEIQTLLKMFGDVNMYHDYPNKMKLALVSSWDTFVYCRVTTSRALLSELIYRKCLLHLPINEVAN